MRIPSVKAGPFLLLLFLGLSSSVASPLWDFQPADSLFWRADTLEVDLLSGETGSTSLIFLNTLEDSLGTMSLSLPSHFYSESGGLLDRERMTVLSGDIVPLAPGDSSLVELQFSVPAETPPGLYYSSLRAVSEDHVIVDSVVLELRIRDERRLVIAPNPVYCDRHSSVEFRIACDEDMSAVIDIYTQAMEKVIRLAGGEVWEEGSVQSLHWDLCNEAGRPLASGMYIVLARYEISGIAQVESQRLMLLR